MGIMDNGLIRSLEQQQKIINRISAPPAWLFSDLYSTSCRLGLINNIRPLLDSPIMRSLESVSGIMNAISPISKSLSSLTLGQSILRDISAHSHIYATILNSPFMEMLSNQKGIFDDITNTVSHFTHNINDYEIVYPANLEIDDDVIDELNSRLLNE